MLHEVNKEEKIIFWGKGGEGGDDEKKNMALAIPSADRGTVPNELCSRT